MVKRFGVFIIALLQTVLLVSIASTQLVLADIISFGIDVPLADRLATTLQDIVGLGPALLVLFAPTFAIAFLIAAFAASRVQGYRTLWYSAAGCLSLPLVIYAIRLAMGATILASARTPSGMLALAVIGLAGGWTFARLSGGARDA